MIDATHSPKRNVLVGGVENGTNQAAQATNNDEERKFPDRKVGSFSRSTIKITEAEELVHIRLSPETINVAYPKECRQCGHGAKERSPNN